LILSGLKKHTHSCGGKSGLFQPEEICWARVRRWDVLWCL